MNRIEKARPSPALIVAAIALIAALGGSAVAEVASTSLTKPDKKQVKKIAKKQGKKQANKQITKKAPGLSVASAETATTADSATTATSANPIAFARVGQTGTVDASRSKNIADSNVAEESGLNDGFYCFRDLPFSFKGAVATVDGAAAASDFDSAQFSIGDPVSRCSAGAQAIVVTSVQGNVRNAGFFIVFYN